MKTIWKYPFLVRDGMQTFQMPQGASIKMVEQQDGQPCL